MRTVTTTPPSAASARARASVLRADRTAALLLALITAPVTVPGQSAQVPLAALVLLLAVVAGLALVLALTWCRLLTASLDLGRDIATTAGLAAAERHLLLTAATWAAGIVLTGPVPRTWTVFWFASSLLCLLLALAPRPSPWTALDQAPCDPAS